MTLTATLTTMNTEPKKYAPYLQKGFNFLQINTTLLGYISALGAYRRKMRDIKQDTDFLSEFYPIAKQTALLLEKSDRISDAEFENRYRQITTKLQRYTEQNQRKNRPHFSVPLQQIQMIAQLLPQLRQAVK